MAGSYSQDAIEELGYEGSYGDLTDEQRAKVDNLVDNYKARNKDSGGAVSDLGKLFKKILNKKKNGGMMNKRLTKTVPPKKGPNSQGMRGTGAAIRGTKFKGVF